ncbi:MAG TPA: DUF1501 domain-containing protein [Kofleriaceae bacterium]|nr:DUF1501 domain-containing protein [Kofleriaceae bacterium]
MRRRELLQLLGAAAGAYAIAPHGRALAQQPSPRPPKRLVLVFVTGGWDAVYALDPKDASHASVPAGTVQAFEGLDVLVDPSRPGVGAFFTKYAGISAVVKGICTDAINHNECQRRIATGTREETKPDFGAVVAHDLGNALPLPYLILGDTAWTGPYAVSSGRVGATNQIVDLLDPSAQGGTQGRPSVLPPPQGIGWLSDQETALLRSYAQASVDRAHATRGALGYNRARVDDFLEAIDRAAQLRTLRAGFGTRGDALAYRSQIALALDALQQGISHAVMVSTGLLWDTHSDNWLQAGFHDQLFAGLTALVDGLAARPGLATGTTMLDDTVVAVFSELSRTPYLGGDDPHAGKGHWPVTPALVIGAGVKGGKTFGATDDNSGSLPIDLATGQPDPSGTTLLYSHFVAGMLSLCGVDPGVHLPNVPVFDAFAV